MKFLIALPDHKYYLWQMLVQMNNLQKFGFDKDTIYLIGLIGKQKSNILKNIIQKSKTGCRFHTYKDGRENFSYSPSLTAYLLKKFFSENPEYKSETFFYIDPDVIFNKKMKFSDLEKNDVWYMSDTKSYLDSKYIKSKGEELFKEMCDIVGIDPKIVEKNDNRAGGAQIMIKNNTPEFWEKVEKDSVSLYLHMRGTSDKYCPNAPIQAWTAEMWSLLWNAWLFNYETKIIKRFDFAWATDKIKKWDNVSIYHNAGAVNSKNSNLFAKTDYQISPFKRDFDYDKTYCSAKYVKEIKETEKKFSSIIW